MEVIYSDQVIPEIVNKRSIFLAGPTPRCIHLQSWRLEAIDILETLDYNGFVFVPELSARSKKYDYINQVEWEKKGLTIATRVVFWIPRCLPDMPGFTTNIEFGMNIGNGRTIYGRPDDAEHIRYLDWLYKSTTYKEPFNNLKEMLEYTVAL